MWHSFLYPSQLRRLLDLATQRDARLSWPSLLDCRFSAVADRTCSMVHVLWKSCRLRDRVQVTTVRELTISRSVTVSFTVAPQLYVVCTVWRRCTCRTTSSASRTRTVVVSGRHRHHFWLSDEQDSVPSATVPSQWSAVASGTFFLIPSPLLHLSLSSGHASNHTYLNGHSRLTVTDTYLQCLHRTVRQSFSSF